MKALAGALALGLALVGTGARGAPGGPSQLLSEQPGFHGPRWTEALALRDLEETPDGFRARWWRSAPSGGGLSQPDLPVRGLRLGTQGEPLLVLPVEDLSLGELLPELRGPRGALRFHRAVLLLVPRSLRVLPARLLGLLPGGASGEATGPNPELGPGEPSGELALAPGGHLLGVLDPASLPGLQAASETLGLSPPGLVSGSLGAGFPDRLLGVPRPGPLGFDLRAPLPARPGAGEESRAGAAGGVRAGAGAEAVAAVGGRPWSVTWDQGELFLRDRRDGAWVTGLRGRLLLGARESGVVLPGELRWGQALPDGRVPLHGLATGEVWGRALGLGWLEIREPFLRFRVLPGGGQPASWTHLLGGRVRVGAEEVEFLAGPGSVESPGPLLLAGHRLGLGDLLTFVGPLGAGPGNAAALTRSALRRLAPLSLRRVRLLRDPVASKPEFRVRGQLRLATVPRGEFRGRLGDRGIEGRARGPELALGEVVLEDPRYHLLVRGAATPRLGVEGRTRALGSPRWVRGEARREGLVLETVGYLAPGYDAWLEVSSGPWNLPAPRVRARLGEVARRRLALALEAREEGRGRGGVDGTLEVLEARAELGLGEYLGGEVPRVRVRLRRGSEGRGRVEHMSLGLGSSEESYPGPRGTSAAVRAPGRGLGGAENEARAGHASPDPSLETALAEFRSLVRELGGGLAPEELTRFLRASCASVGAGSHPLGRVEVLGWSLAEVPGEEAPTSFCGARVHRQLEVLTGRQDP